MLIGRDQRDIRADRLMNEIVKCFGIGVLDHFCNDHSLARDRADNRNLILCASERGFPASLSVHVVRLAADVSFVNFHFAGQRERIAFHRSTPAMADEPASTPVSTRALAKYHAPDL